MAKTNSKKNKKGASVKSIEQMVEEQNSIAEPYFEALDKLNENIENVGEEEIIKDEIEREEQTEMDKMKTQILDRNIRGAIIATKDMGNRGLLDKQLKAIINSYKEATGIELNEKKVEYIKTLKDRQATEIITIINAYKRYMRLQQNTQLATNE